MSLSSRPIPCCLSLVLKQVGGREGSVEVSAWAGVELPLVQILVVVATIQMGTLKTEVEKGFMRTAFGHE